MRTLTPEDRIVRDVERRFLRRWGWCMPVLGILAAGLLGDGFWGWVDSSVPGRWFDWGRAFGPAGLALGVAGLLFAGAWRLLVGRKGGFAVVAPCALAGLLAVECAVRLSTPQAAFWLAVRSRLGEQPFMREVCYVRLEEAAGRMDSAPAVVVIGSSQVLNGVDVPALDEALRPERRAIRRAMFGMTPLKALCMRAYFPFRPGDLCATMLSEFDFTNQEEFPADWFRPYASWRTLPDVLSCMGARTCRAHWRQAVDGAMAATWELWRMRDGAREIAFHAVGREAAADAASAGSTSASGAALAAEKARGPLQRAAAEEKAFVRLTERLQADGVRFVVFEGDVHPAIQSAFRVAEKRRIRAWLQGFGSASFRYVPIDELGLSFDLGDWKDMTHLSSTGRAKFTRAMAATLQSEP